MGRLVFATRIQFVNPATARVFQCIVLGMMQLMHHIGHYSFSVAEAFDGRIHLHGILMSLSD